MSEQNNHENQKEEIKNSLGENVPSTESTTDSSTDLSVPPLPPKTEEKAEEKDLAWKVNQLIKLVDLSRSRGAFDENVGSNIYVVLSKLGKKESTLEETQKLINYLVGCVQFAIKNGKLSFEEMHFFKNQVLDNK